MAEQNQQNKNEEKDLNQLLKVRREKLKDLQDNGKDPFQITKFDVTAHSSEIKDNFEQMDGKEVTIAGRMMSKRVMGKASFCNVQDLKGNIQSYVARDSVGEEAYKDFKKMDIGDIVGIKGTVFRTKMGEISVHAESIVLLSKSLQILPEKFHGLTNTDIRYRQRYVDLIMNPEVKDTFVKRSQILKEIRSRLTDEQGGGVEGTLMAAVMKNRKMFHSLLKFASYAQKPFTGGTQFQRHLPAMFLGKHGFKALPAIANEAFRDRWAKIAPRVATPRYRVAIFGGCAQDFIYPEQLEACVKVLGARGVAVEYPMAQTCCGLPLEMMGQRKTSVDVAKQNLEAFDASKYDAIITLCASCASHLKHVYPHILEGKADAARVQLFSDKVTDYSSFVHDVLGLTEKDFNNSGEKVTYHASCHICRGLGVTKAPRDLIADAATYVPCAEEDVCCGFGGTYSMKFPEISGTLLAKKLKHIEETGASRVVMDCPGCVLQIRGGAEKDGKGLKVTHISELLAENLKK